MEPKTGQVTRNSKTYTFKIWCDKCPHPGEPRASLFAADATSWNHLHHDNEEAPLSKVKGRLCLRGERTWGGTLD